MFTKYIHIHRNKGVIERLINCKYIKNKLNKWREMERSETLRTQDQIVKFKNNHALNRKYINPLSHVSEN